MYFCGFQDYNYDSYNLNKQETFLGGHKWSVTVMFLLLHFYHIAEGKVSR